LTDADLPAAAIARNSARLVESVTATREIRAVLAESKFIPIDGGFTAAHSSVLEPCVAEGWLAAGDASLSFDPLSAQGLLHAPFTGLAAAEAADAYLPATAKRRPGRNAQGPRPLSGQKRRGSLHRNAAWRIALINIPRKCASEPRRS